MVISINAAGTYHIARTDLAAVGGEGPGPGELLLAGAGVPGTFCILLMDPNVPEAATAGEEDLSLQVGVPCRED